MVHLRGKIKWTGPPDAAWPPNAEHGKQMFGLLADHTHVVAPDRSEFRLVPMFHGGVFATTLLEIQPRGIVSLADRRLQLATNDEFCLDGIVFRAK